MATRTSDFIILYILPVGFFVLLTGLFWLGEKSLYHKLYSLLVVAPTLTVLLLSQTGELKKLLRNPLVIIFICFGSYTALSLCWSNTDHAIISLIRRPLNVLTLFLAFGLVELKTRGKSFRILFLSAWFAVICGGLSLIYFFFTHYTKTGGLDNLTFFKGYGALHNALLVSHVYGFFTVFFIALWFSGRDSHPPLPVLSLGILGMVILSTGSRTPLLAVTISILWLSICFVNRRTVVAISILLSSSVTLLMLYPEALTHRGLSYRPEIWLEAIKQGLEKLWLGHGFDHSLIIRIESLEHFFTDPHNIELAVFLSGGIVGLTIWLTLYTVALFYSWRNRDNSLVMIASALLVFGFAAGLTEGRAFMSRPKEHWFLIWIPFALLSSTWIANDQQREIQLEKQDT